MKYSYVILLRTYSLLKFEFFFEWGVKKNLICINYNYV